VVEAAQPAQLRTQQELYITEKRCVFTTLYLSCAQFINMCTCCALCTQFPDTDSPEGSSLLVYRSSPPRHPYDPLLHRTQTARLAQQRWQEWE
jgi:hypothetical protein